MGAVTSWFAKLSRGGRGRLPDDNDPNRFNGVDMYLGGG
jgi:hypothetical protein